MQLQHLSTKRSVFFKIDDKSVLIEYDPLAFCATYYRLKPLMDSAPTEPERDLFIPDLLEATISDWGLQGLKDETVPITRDAIAELGRFVVVRLALTLAVDIQRSGREPISLSGLR
jgi:hypothetical protein